MIRKIKTYIEISISCDLYCLDFRDLSQKGVHAKRWWRNDHGFGLKQPQNDIKHIILIKDINVKGLSVGNNLPNPLRYKFDQWRSHAILQARSSISIAWDL